MIMIVIVIVVLLIGWRRGYVRNCWFLNFLLCLVRKCYFGYLRARIYCLLILMSIRFDLFWGCLEIVFWNPPRHTCNYCRFCFWFFFYRRLDLFLRLFRNWSNCSCFYGKFFCILEEIEGLLACILQNFLKNLLKFGWSSLLFGLLVLYPRYRNWILLLKSILILILLDLCNHFYIAFSYRYRAPNLLNFDKNMLSK